MEYYYEHGMGELLEISDEHVIWKIKKEFDWDRYNLTCDWMIKRFEHRYKDLKVFCCGRSGRHVCVEDNSRNRKRYDSLKSYCEKLQNELVDIFNS